MITDSDYFAALNGRKFRYIGMSDPTTLKVWEKLPMKNGLKGESLGGLKIEDVDIDTLKELRIWDDLSADVQKIVLDRTLQQQNAVKELMGRARAGRRNKYPNVPRELTCVKCQAKISIAPCILVKRVENLAKKKGILMTVDDYVKDYQCLKCNPGQRGRKANPMFANLPKELVCKCGFKTKVNCGQLVKAANKKNVTPQEFVRDYVCQKCRPSRGMHLRKKGKK